MSDLQKISGNALVAHMIAGYPDLDTTEKLIRSMADSGVDAVILEIPFSDPIAGGPEVQAVCDSALKAGTTTDDIFDSLAKVRKVCNVPVLMMTYYNPVFVYGGDRFMERCRDTGVCGVIVPDIPLEEKEELESSCRKYGISRVALVAPSFGDRIETILDSAEELVYILRFQDQAGFPDGYVSDPSAIAEMAHRKGLKCIADSGPGEAGDVLKYADGAVDGTDIMTLITKHGRNSVQFVSDYARGVRTRV